MGIFRHVHDVALAPPDLRALPFVVGTMKLSMMSIVEGEALQVRRWRPAAAIAPRLSGAIAAARSPRREGSGDAAVRQSIGRRVSDGSVSLAGRRPRLRSRRRSSLWARKIGLAPSRRPQRGAFCRRLPSPVGPVTGDLGLLP